MDWYKYSPRLSEFNSGQWYLAYLAEMDSFLSNPIKVGCLALRYNIDLLVKFKIQK